MPKINLNRTPMPKQEAEKRASSFQEVAIGYTLDMAKAEASRCLQCPKRPCVGGCPVNISIPDFVKSIVEGDLARSIAKIKEANSLPGICGRVCPQESQCEAQCVMAKKGASVAIGRLERYVADWERTQGITMPSLPAPSHKKVGIVGCGPAGLTAAASLARRGHQVTIFEALHSPGGVLVYGIPEFRLPKTIVQGEVNFVRSLGVELKLDWVVGKTITIDELFGEGYKAIFVGTGAGRPQFLGVPGENLGGIFSANEFLVRINLMKSYLFPSYDTPLTVGKRVVVVGGGNVAMDAARCAKRLGAEVTVVYRRSEAELPARREEVENAQEEGIIFRLLTNPVAFHPNAQGKVQTVECMEMELGEPDASGRRRPIEKKGSNFRLEVDTVVSAVGTIPNPLIPQSTPDLKITSHGTVTADDKTGRTSKAGVWAGGDVVSGAATVISAMGAGKLAAADIDLFLRS
ncbi:MAG: NADPH-dependent glutamate synthase [Chloroflexi bacterium]|nr:NADPH-dependent glutamate synthase [Chloroflexota bacterium]